MGLKRRSLSKSLSRISPLSSLGGQLGSAVFIFISLALLGISSANPLAVKGIRAGLSDMMVPVIAVISRPAQNAALFVRDVSGLAQLQEQNALLREENTRLKEWYQKAIALQEENTSLKDLLKVKIDPHNRYITARVLTDSGNSFVKSLIVSAGTADGVEEGQAVISSQGVVGRIIEVGQSTARILLANDINARIPVIVEGTGQNAIMAGQNTDSPRLVHLPPDIKLADGARVMTSGLGGMFPYGLPVGRIVMANDGVYKIKLYADFQRLIYVRIIDKVDDPNLKKAP